MGQHIDFTIIIPHRESIDTLIRLFSSIPISDSIEIIVIDNSPLPITREQIDVERPYQLLWCDPCRHAGGARNVGLDSAHGKWLIFADADDYFAPRAFDVFYDNINNDADIIYFASQGIYGDTRKPSNRGEHYNSMVRDFLRDPFNDINIRVGFSVPWAKMIRHNMVKENNIRFEEIRASNDVMFSLLTGFCAKKIAAVDSIVYIVTTNAGSLTRRRNFDVIEARLGATLRKNKYLKEHGHSDLQSSVMFYLKESLRFGIVPFFLLFWKVLKFRQNIFIGISRWTRTYIKNSKLEKREAKYIVR